LSLIERWTLTVGEDGAATYVAGWRPANLDEPTRKVEVVPADQLARAVALLRELSGTPCNYNDAGWCARHGYQRPCAIERAAKIARGE
jgi:hypothetical protein